MEYDFVEIKNWTVNIRVFDVYKHFRPGDNVVIRVSSHMKLKKVSYCWDDGEKKSVKTFFNRRWFNVTVPDVPGNKPVLRIFTEVQFKDGTRHTYEHSFEINNIH